MARRSISFRPLAEEELQALRQKREAVAKKKKQKKEKALWLLAVFGVKLGWPLVKLFG